MNYHSIVTFVWSMIVALWVGAMIDRLFTHTWWPIIGLGILFLIVSLVLLFWSKITKPRLEQIQKKLRMKVLKVLTDLKNNQAEVTFEIINAQSQKISLKSLDNSIIKRNTEEIKGTLKLRNVINLKEPITEVKAIFDLPSKYEAIYGGENSLEHWEFQIHALLNTLWGETIWTPNIELDQTSRISNRLGQSFTFQARIEDSEERDNP